MRSLHVGFAIDVHLTEKICVPSCRSRSFPVDGSISSFHAIIDLSSGECPLAAAALLWPRGRAAA